MAHNETLFNIFYISIQLVLFPCGLCAVIKLAQWRFSNWVLGKTTNVVPVTACLLNRSERRNSSLLGGWALRSQSNDVPFISAGLDSLVRWPFKIFVGIAYFCIMWPQHVAVDLTSEYLEFIKRCERGLAHMLHFEPSATQISEMASQTKSLWGIKIYSLYCS